MKELENPHFHHDHKQVNKDYSIGQPFHTSQDYIKAELKPTP
jgi:hypothetical protein